MLQKAGFHLTRLSYHELGRLADLFSGRRSWVRAIHALSDKNSILRNAAGSWKLGPSGADQAA